MGNYFLMRWLATSFLGLLFFAQATAGTVDRVEPPFWWHGFKHNELQILIYGDGIGQFDVTIDYPGVTINRVERVDSENYLFAYIDIDDASRPGSFDIVLRHGDISVTHEYELREKNPDPLHVKGFSPSDTIYLITPDRFANGDLSNDTLNEFADEKNRADDYGRHGGDLAGISQHLDYIQDMGFTAIWLNPILENAMPKASYHGYAITDFYTVDPRYGGNSQYLALTQKARAQGIGVVMDMVANHIGIEHWWMKDMPSADWINISAAYEDPDFYLGSTHARTSNQDPYASEIDKAEFADGWFDYSMPDLNQRNPLLADYLIQNAIWWTEYVGLAGIRMDTYPYSDKHFISEWTRRIMQEYPDFNITGEEWTANPAIVSYWQRGKNNHDGYVSYLPSVLDFPLQIAFAESLLIEPKSWGSVWTPAYEMLGNDFLYPDPGNLVIFPDNHDMSRIFTQVGEDYDLFQMAIVYYLTMRGIPSIYYGTEVLMSHTGTDSHGAIREEFPGGWADSEKNAFTGRGLSSVESAAQTFMRKLLNWRKAKAVIHSGKLMQYAPMGNVYAYFRYDEISSVMVIMNRGDSAETLEFDHFAERIGESKQATDVLSGRDYRLEGSISLEPRSVLLLEFDNQ